MHQDMFCMWDNMTFNFSTGRLLWSPVALRSHKWIFCGLPLGKSWAAQGAKGGQ